MAISCDHELMLTINGDPSDDLNVLTIPMVRIMMFSNLFVPFFFLHLSSSHLLTLWSFNTAMENGPFIHDLPLTYLLNMVILCDCSQLC